MSATLDQVKELLKRVPNLKQMVEEAEKPREHKIAETAYIYNAYGDLDLQYLGVYMFHLPVGEATRIDAKEHREVDHGKSVDGNMVWTNIHLPGESIAREIIESQSRGYNKKGCEVFLGGPDVPKAVRERCEESARRHILAEIAQFKVNREKAKAGTPGYKIKPDGRVYSWMERYSPDDEVFAEQSQKTEQAKQTATAIERLTDIVAELASDKKRASTVKPDGSRPRRNPMETPEAYRERTGFELE